jgi:hypothetical protein
MDREAIPKPVTAFYPKHCVNLTCGYYVAERGKPPRHKSPAKKDRRLSVCAATRYQSSNQRQTS